MVNSSDIVYLKPYYFFECPHCGGGIQVDESQVNCQIFRHALGVDGSQMNPHASSEQTNIWISSGQIHGCGKPFRLRHCANKNREKGANYNVVETCEYI